MAACACVCGGEGVDRGGSTLFRVGDLLSHFFGHMRMISQYRLILYCVSHVAHTCILVKSM